MDLLRSAVLCILLQLAQGHLVITYPGWRGNNLILSGSIEETNGLGTGVLGSQDIYPYGMQWIYPCGGLPITTNRTQFPVRSGAIAFQPGWFTGHQHALIYINIGLGTLPMNYSTPLWPPFEIEGPTDNPYPGTVCLPQVDIPPSLGVEVGQNATIQIIEAAVHGAGMFSCVDITFVESVDGDHAVNTTNCYNSTDITFPGRTTSVSSGNLTTTSRELFSLTPTAAPTQAVATSIAATSSADRSTTIAGGLVAVWFVICLGFLSGD